MSENIDIKKFDLNKITAQSNVLCYGKRNSGKTTCMINIFMVVGQHYPIGCAIIPTAKVRLQLSKYIPSSLIWSQLDIDKLRCVLSQFTETTPTWMNNPNSEHTEPKPVVNWLLMMDDCGFDEKAFRKDVFAEMYMNGRQFGQGTILNLQRLKSIPPGLRTQLDYVFCFRDLNQTVQENIHKEFFSFLPLKTFKQIFMKCTEGYHCIVVDVARAQRAKASNSGLGIDLQTLSECVFTFLPTKIEDLPQFNMFDPYVWKMDIAWKRLCTQRRNQPIEPVKTNSPVISIEQSTTPFSALKRLQTPSLHTPLTRTPLTRTPLTRTPLTRTPLTRTPFTRTPLISTTPIVTDQTMEPTLVHSVPINVRTLRPSQTQKRQDGQCAGNACPKIGGIPHDRASPR